MMRKKRSKKRGPVRAKRVRQDGINFASGLERYMYLALKKAKIKATYEGKTYVVQEGFEFTEFNLISFAKQGNLMSRGNFIIKTRKYQDLSVQISPK